MATLEALRNTHGAITRAAAHFGVDPRQLTEKHRARSKEVALARGVAAAAIRLRFGWTWEEVARWHFPVQRHTLADYAYRAEAKDPGIVLRIAGGNGKDML